MFKRSLLSLVIACGLMFSYVSLAYSDVPAPGYEAIGRFAPTNLPPGGEGQLIVYVYNLGAGQGSTSATLTDTLPAGVVVKTGEDPTGCTGSTVVTCAVEGVPLAGEPEKHHNPLGECVGESVKRTGRDNGERRRCVGCHEHDRSGTLWSATSAHGIRHAVWISSPDGTIDTQAGSHP